MRKWQMRIIMIAVTLLLLKSHQGLVESLSNFMIDGILPFTNTALNSAETFVVVGLGALGIYKLVTNLRFDMLRRRALSFHAKQQASVVLSTDTAKASLSQKLNDVEDLELAHTSL